jgi:carboxypeptidase T
MKNFKNLSRTGIIAIALMIAAAVYFSINGFNLISNQSDSQTVQGEKVSKVRIYAKNDNDFARMQKQGLFLDGGIYKSGLYFETVLTESEIGMLQKSGVPYEILIDDMDTYQKNLPKMTDAEIRDAMKYSEEVYDVTHNIYGTLRNMGYLKYSEMVAKLDSMRIEYPNLVSVKWSIGNSIENREQWVVRITKNPDAPTGRPEVFLHAVTHAREPLGLSQQVYFVYWLLENYNIDPIATYILNNREIYWLPILNPDGYVFNETYSGGNWRCNKHLTSPPSLSCGPVDLNRNFGLYQYWNSSNGGSSTNQCSGGSGTYRGTSPFSEIESQNVMNFVNSRNFQAGMGAHTYGNDLLKPWAWCDPSPTPDDYKFNEYMADMTMYNHYITGTPHGALGYYVRGCTDDWYYEDSTHASHHVIFMTPETGTSFWPSQSQILPNCEAMLWPNQYICLVAGPYVNPVSKAFNQPNYNPGQSGTFKLVFRNKGLLPANNVKVQMIPWNSYVTIPTQQYTYSSLASFATDSSTFNFTLAANAPVNCAIPTTLNLKIDTSTVYTETVYIYVGSGSITLNDDAESGIGNWSVQGSWSLHTDSYHSPTHSFAYAPYPNNADYSLTLSSPINMQSVPVCYLTFWNRYSLETGWDFGYVEVSSNNGSTWQQIIGYSGTNLTWTEQSFDITQYVNSASQFKIRFRLTSDGNTLYQGWWVDDIKFTNYCLGTVGVPGVTNIPKTYALQQNYPNPFNPVTVIKYQIPQPVNVSIKVFDLLGKEVASLVNEKKEPGYYEVSFNGGNLASGLYFYRIEAGNFVETKKMMLIK